MSPTSCACATSLPALTCWRNLSRCASVGGDQGPLPDCSEGLVGRPVVLPCPDHSLWHGPHETAACCGSNMPFPLQTPCLFVFYLGVAQPSSLSKQREQGGQMVSCFMTLHPG